jgi:hypothetical protein
MDGAIPVEARKKPNRIATIAGPALMDPPLINTTRMIANSRTTDSEMATLITPSVGPLSRPGDATPRTPPEPSCHQRGRAMRPVTHRPHLCRSARVCRPCAEARLRAVVRQFEEPPAQGIRPYRFHLHTTRSQLIRIVATSPSTAVRSRDRRGAEADIPLESPAGLMPRLVRKYHDKQGSVGAHNPASDDVLAVTSTVTSTARNPGYPQRIARNHVRRFTNSCRER